MATLATACARTMRCLRFIEGNDASATLVRASAEHNPSAPPRKNVSNRRDDRPGPRPAPRTALAFHKRHVHFLECRAKPPCLQQALWVRKRAFGFERDALDQRARI